MVKKNPSTVGFTDIYIFRLLKLSLSLSFNAFKFMFKFSLCSSYFPHIRLHVLQCPRRMLGFSLAGHLT